MIRLQDIRMRPKLTALLLLTGLLPLVLFWWFENHQTNNWLIEQAFSRLETARQIGVADIKRYFSERRADMELLAQSTGEMRRQSFDSLITLRDLKKERIESFFNNHLQDLMQLAANPDFIKRIAAIDWLFRQAGRKPDDTHWRETVEGFVPWVTGRQAVFGIEDLYFISSLGDVSYSLGHKSELGKNIHHSPLKETSLAQIFQPGLEAPTIQDFQPYALDNQVASALFAAPVKREGNTIGTVVMRLSRPVLTRLMQAGVDRDLTSDLYLAAADGLRSDPLVAVNQPVRTGSVAAIQSALEKKTGLGTRVGLHGQPVLSAWAPVQIPGLNWGLVVERDLARQWSALPKTAKNWLQKFTESAGYYDLFLIQPNGHVVYTTAHQADFGTNLATGPYAQTNLGQLFKQVVQSKQFGLSDLAPYPPSDNQPAFFMAQPVLENDQVVLVVALQLPPDALTGLMRQGAHAGAIQTFLVGPDQRLRADAFTNTANPTTASAFAGAESNQVLAATAVANALDGQTGTLITQRADGTQVLSSFAPMPVDEMNWALVAEIEINQIKKAGNPRMTLLSMVGGLLLLVLAGSWLIKVRLIHPLLDTSTALNRIASGRFETFGKESRKDELGILTRSVADVAHEIAQAGHRIQHAAEPLSARIRRLASFAITLSREASAGSETINEAKAGIEETARIFVDETDRLMAEQKRLLDEQTIIANNAEKMARLTTQAVAGGKQIATETVTAWHQINGQIRLLQQSALLLIEAVQKSTDEGLRPGKHGKHGKEWFSLATTIGKLTHEIQSELNDLEELIDERLRAVSQMDANLDKLLPPMPTLRRVQTTQSVVRNHTPERTLMALEKLDLLLKKNVSSARDIIIAAKALFDITTGPLRQSTAFFTKNDPPDPDALLESPQLTLEKSDAELQS